MTEPFATRVKTLLLIGALACGAALYVVQLQVSRGPAQQSITVRWAPEADELTRRAAERSLRLRDGEELEPGKWGYHLQDYSRESIRAVVTHPLVADTAHINREQFRILIDAPSVPAPLRRVLEMGLGPTLSLILLAIGIAATWPVRRELVRATSRFGSIPGLDVGVAVACLCVGFAFFYDNGHSVDENVHYDQIVRFAGGDWTLHPSLTMLPGFHLLVAGLAAATGGASEFSARLIVFVLSLATVAAFHALARTLHRERAGMLTLQFTLLPILFPQFFLIYTDVASLLFVLLMVQATVSGRLRTAGALGLMACLVRQNNVMWVAFAMVWAHLRDFGWTWRPLGILVARYWTFIATGLLFLLFVAANGGEAALGDDVGSHPLGALHVSNVFFMLFLSCIFFPPLVWGYRREMRASLRRWWPWVSVAVLFPVFWFGFVVDHPHNTERADYFLTNALLLEISATPLRKLALFAAVAAVWLSAIAVPMKAPWRLLYAFAILFLLPEWLIVPRYYLIPLSLFLVAREPASPGSERLQTAVFAVGSIALFVVMERGLRWL